MPYSSHPRLSDERRPLMFHLRASHRACERRPDGTLLRPRPIVAALIGGLLFPAAICGAQTSARAADWPTFDGNAARAAWLNTDRSINRKNVARLKRKWVTKLDAVADSTPIYMHSVTRG